MFRRKGLSTNMGQECDGCEGRGGSEIEEKGIFFLSYLIFS